MGFFEAILAPFRWLVSWIMFMFHEGFTFLGMDPASGWTWVLSIVGLVVIIRAALIPVFVKQIKAQRGMQALQPDLRKLQQKYKGKTDQLSRQAMTQAQMALYKKHGTNPFAACLPIATDLHLTRVDTRLERADAWFPPFDASQWSEAARVHHPADARHAHAFDFVDCVRRVG